MITLHKIVFPTFSVLLWRILRTTLVSSIGEHEKILAGIIESKIYYGIFNNMN